VDINGRAVVADFGLSFRLSNLSDNSHSVTEAARWMAPELMAAEGHHPTPESDMYSFGTIMNYVCFMLAVTSATILLISLFSRSCLLRNPSESIKTHKYGQPYLGWKLPFQLEARTYLEGTGSSSSNAWCHIIPQLLAHLPKMRINSFKGNLVP
jgi:serine/threonine protein kinase